MYCFVLVTTPDNALLPRNVFSVLVHQPHEQLPNLFESFITVST